MLDHTQVCTPQITPQTGWKVLLYSPNRPDLAPFDYHIFGLLTRSLWRHHYTNYEAWLSDRLIDLHWVQALTVPMHLGLIDGPFVPHNPISAQESPVHLPKFQMAPQTYNLNVLWVQETNPDILSFSLKKSWQANPFQVPQWSPYGERYQLTGHFYISLDISLYLKGPKKRVALMATDAHSRALFFIPFGFPSKGALPPGPPHGVPLERDASFLGPSFIHHSKSLVYEPPSWFQIPLGQKGPLWREMPISRGFLNMSSRDPSEEALLKGPPQWASSELRGTASGYRGGTATFSRQEYMPLFDGEKDYW